MTIFERVVAVAIEQLGTTESEITLETNFQNDLGADSLDVVELIMEFEEEFDVEVSDTVAETLVTIGDVVSYIDQKQKEA